MITDGGLSGASGQSDRALQRWQQLTRQSSAPTATRHFFAAPSGDVCYEDEYYSEVKDQTEIEEKDGSRLCDLHAWPGLSNLHGEDARHECASHTSWDLLSTSAEYVAAGKEAMQMVEEASDAPGRGKQ